MAFGDMPNDAEMLWLGGGGFAMASGQPALIAKVGRTCPSFHEDGVAQTIERCSPNGPSRPALAIQHERLGEPPQT